MSGLNAMDNTPMHTMPLIYVFGVWVFFGLGGAFSMWYGKITTQLLRSKTTVQLTFSTFIYGEMLIKINVKGNVQ